MRINDTVGFFDTSGNRHQATITKVGRSGKSGYKTLDLTYRLDGADVAVEEVAHESDADGGAFWLEKGAQRREPEPTREPVRKAKKL